MSQEPNLIIGPGCVRLRDGRLLTFFTAGPRDGFPVVYCHGAIGSPRWRTPGIDAVIDELSIRYLVVNRPGFNGSDSSPGRTVIDFAHDLGDLMTILGHRQFSIVGVSAGAPYALACGRALAERIIGLAAVSPLGPPGGPGASRGWRYRLPLAPFASPRVGPAVASLCLRALGLRRHTSPEAMIADYQVCRRDWGFEPADVRVPVELWHGRGDRVVPLSHALALAAAIPACTPRVEPRGGHFFYSRMLPTILASLLPEQMGELVARSAA